MEIYTIRDVARKAGVAVSTVSRVLNGRPDVSEETRKKVMDVVEEYGFVQNRNARNLKNTKPTFAAIIVRGRRNAFLNDIAEQMIECAQGLKTPFLIKYIDEEDDEFDTMRQLYAEKRAASFILLGARMDERSQAVRDVGVPVVFATVDAGNMGYANASSVCIDDRAATHAMMDWILQQGHTRVAVIGGCRDGEDIFAKRYLGAMDSLSARDQEIARRAQAVVDSVIAPGMTDLQKETALHDYIIYHADYLRDESQDTDSVYGFFERGWIQCSGYVDTFFLLGRMAGLEVTGVSGFVLEDGEAHSWNLVRLDGMWYAVDVTWDDPIGGGHEAHTYLNIPHRCFDGLRTWDPRTLPGGAYAQSLDANWYYAGVPVLWDLDAAVSAASMQIDQTGEALLILEGGLQSDDVARQLANRYQRTIWTGNLLEQSWARMYSFSFKQ